MKKGLLVLLLCAAVAIVGYYWFSRSQVQALSEKSLTFAEVKQGTIRDVVSATGLVEPREIVVVSSETPGTVMKLLRRVGETVMEGDDLAQLDDRKIGLKLEEAKNGVQVAEAAVQQANSAALQAQAALTQAIKMRDAAERYWETQKKLEGVGGIRSERDQAEAQFEAAKAGIEAAQAGIHVAKAGIMMAHAKKQASLTAKEEADLSLKMTFIKVLGAYQRPKDTMRREFLILERKVQEGQMVGPQSGPLFTLAGNLDTIEVHAQVAEGDINKVHKGLKASFKITGYNDEDIEFDGLVKELRPMGSNIKGAVYFDTVVEVKNRKDAKTRQEWLLRPGMTISIDIIRIEHENVWKVPVQALNFKLEEAYQSEAAKAHLAAWSKRPDAREWYPIWIWDKTSHTPQPIFIRIGAKNGEIGLKDSEGNEVLEWEPGKTPTGPFRIIIGAPPARAPGFFDQPANVKI